MIRVRRHIATKSIVQSPASHFYFFPQIKRCGSAATIIVSNFGAFPQYGVAGGRGRLSVALPRIITLFVTHHGELRVSNAFARRQQRQQRGAMPCLDSVTPPYIDTATVCVKLCAITIRNNNCSITTYFRTDKIKSDDEKPCTSCLLCLAVFIVLGSPTRTDVPSGDILWFFVF